MLRVNEMPSGTLLERVLAAIIMAHPSEQLNVSARQRLETAMSALVGPASADKRDMEEALLYMSRMRRRHIADMDLSALSNVDCRQPQVPSLQDLAATAARNILHCQEDDLPAMADSLCKLFRQRMSVVAEFPDYSQDALETEAVKRICDEFAEWGVKTLL